MQPITSIILQSLQQNGAIEFISDHLSYEYFDSDIAYVSVEAIEFKLKTFFPYQDQNDKTQYEITRNELFFKMVLMGTKLEVEQLVQRAFFALDRLLALCLITYSDATQIALKIRENVLFFERMIEHQAEKNDKGGKE